MNDRDLEYVWNRLSAPCMGALEAHERLVKCGYGEQASELMDVVQKFQDEARKIRVSVSERRAGVIGRQEKDCPKTGKRCGRAIESCNEVIGCERSREAKQL